MGTFVSMIRVRALLVLLVASSGSSAFALEIKSEYTRFDREKDCSVVGRSVGEGDWADYLCPGFRGYPFFLRYTDGRDVVTYGYASKPGMQSFGPFNEASSTVEWRITSSEGGAYAYAAIQRWFVQRADSDLKQEVLVVSKVGQPMTNDGACVVAYIPAAHAGANQQAREIADSRAENFKCNTEKPAIDPSLTAIVAPRR